MQKLLKKFLKQKPEQRTNYRGADAQPMLPWRKYALAGFFGTLAGLYIGQYFPDLYFASISPYLPNFKQLEELAPATRNLKPNPEHPKSIHDIPEHILIKMGRRKAVEGGEFVVKNDVTK
jgi:hypothetical protein